MSSGRVCLEESEDAAGEVALEEPDRFAVAFAFALFAFDVGDCFGVVFASGDDCLVEDAVEFAVAAAVEAMADRAARRGWDRRHAGEFRKRGFVSEASFVRPGDQCLGCADRAEPVLGEECRCGLFGQLLQFPVEFAELCGECFDPVSREPAAPGR